jgi:hypothetical protein
MTTDERIAEALELMAHLMLEKHKAEREAAVTAGKCSECNKKKNLFDVEKNGQAIRACSNCITDQLLTGWSK